MAWSTPATWVDGSVVSASGAGGLNTQIRDNLRYLKGLDGVPRIENPLELPEAATPVTPASGFGRLYFKSDGRLYTLDDAGNEMAVTPLSGSYTPTYGGATTAGVTTYGEQVGRYLRIGTWCAVSLRVWWTSASGTGTAVLALPFQAKSLTSHIQTLSVLALGVTFGGSGLMANIDAGTSVVYLTSPVTDTGSVTVTVEAAGRISLTGIYEVN